MTTRETHAEKAMYFRSNNRISAGTVTVIRRRTQGVNQGSDVSTAQRRNLQNNIAIGLWLLFLMLFLMLLLTASDFRFRETDRVRFKLYGSATID
jgi:hypothetical protein